jgi:hypothetical protein
VEGSQGPVSEAVNELNRISEETEFLEGKLDELLVEAREAKEQKKGRLRDNLRGGGYGIGARIRNILDGQTKIRSVSVRADAVNSRLGQADRNRFRVERKLHSLRNNGDPSAINEFERGYVFRDRFGEFKSRLQEALRY